jgi:hypothetical protein
MKNVFLQQKISTFYRIKKMQIERGGGIMVPSIYHSWIILFIKLIHTSKDVL